jgi:hypothetical protein
MILLGDSVAGRELAVTAVDAAAAALAEVARNKGLPARMNVAAAMAVRILTLEYLGFFVGRARWTL